MEAGQNPNYQIPTRALSNVYYDEKSGLIKLGRSKQKRQFLNLGQAKKFMQSLLIAERIKWLLDQDKTLSIRQLFYTLKHTIGDSDENTFDTQDESNPLIEDVEVLINVLRENLGLIATPKGVLAGPIKIKDVKSGDLLDFTKMGSAGGAIPAIVEENVFQIKECSADYILVVEKYAVWNRLNEDRYWKKNNCLVMTGKGQPARAERRLLHRLSNELKIPVYIFTDMDPYGYYIYSVFKQGSINLAYFSEHSGVPSAKFLGFSVSDVKDFDMPKSSFIKMKDIDIKRLKEIQNYDWFKSKGWKKELEELKKFGYKIEQDALVAKSIEFTSNTYLPTKIDNRMWID